MTNTGFAGPGQRAQCLLRVESGEKAGEDNTEHPWGESGEV